MGGVERATVKLKDKKRNRRLGPGKDWEMDDRHVEDIKKKGIMRRERGKTEIKDRKKEASRRGTGEQMGREPGGKWERWGGLGEERQLKLGERKDA